jgi:hypothetical protein
MNGLLCTLHCVTISLVEQHKQVAAGGSEPSNVYFNMRYWLADVNFSFR